MPCQPRTTVIAARWADALRWAKRQQVAWRPYRAHVPAQPRGRGSAVASSGRCGGATRTWLSLPCCLCSAPTTFYRAAVRRTSLRAYTSPQAKNEEENPSAP